MDCIQQWEHGVKIAVSGATGFVGRTFVPYLEEQRHEVVTIGRADFETDLNAKLADCDVFTHLAGLAHTHDATPSEIEAVNFDLALQAAVAARDERVTRFVLVSTINVVAGGKGILSPSSSIKPRSAYGAAKARAEAALMSLGRLEVVVIRPPLVYGPNVKGNLQRLTQLCLTGFPLPFGSVNNQRSMIGITNLCSALLFVAQAPASAVAGRIFHVAGKNLSLSEMVTTIREAAGLPPRLLPMPVAPMRLGLKLMGRSLLAEQLFDDLLVDSSDLRGIGWNPLPTEIADLTAMARASANALDRPS
jgi:UDP-glucose 4-epimerase